MENQNNPNNDVEMNWDELEFLENVPEYHTHCLDIDEQIGSAIPTQKGGV